MRLGNRVFRCWKKEGHGSLDLMGAVAASCDVYFYQLGLQLGLDAIIQDGVLMGFRDKSGIDLENELNPIYPSSAAYFDRLYGPRYWSPPGTTLNFSIGQGENTQTLINMVKFYQGLAGPGVALTPFIVSPSPTKATVARYDADQELDGLRRAARGGGGARDRGSQPPWGPGSRREDGNGAESARRGPRLVYRLRTGR